MDKEQILKDVLNKFTGNLDEDFKIVLQEAEQYRKLSDVVNFINIPDENKADFLDNYFEFTQTNQTR